MVDKYNADLLIHLLQRLRLTMSSSNIDFPSPPVVSADDLKKCRDTNDYCPILFEWYKYVGELCTFISCIQPDSPAIRQIDNLHYAVIFGLLNRSSRLMLSNIVLSHKGLYGETTSISEIDT